MESGDEQVRVAPGEEELRYRIEVGGSRWRVTEGEVRFNCLDVAGEVSCQPKAPLK